MRPDRIEVSCSCGARGVIESAYGSFTKARYAEFLAAHAVCRQPATPPPTRAAEYARSQGCDCELCKDWAGLPNPMKAQT